MLKQVFAVLIILLLTTRLWPDKASADILKHSSHKIEYMPRPGIGIDRVRPDTTDILKTSFNKIEYLTSQEPGIGSGRPGTEEFLNADIIVKLKDDGNTYGFSLIFFDSNGPSKAMFDTLMAALIYDLRVEITYYEKSGTKQVLRVTVKK